jgi:hypothetical protein
MHDSDLIDHFLDRSTQIALLPEWSKGVDLRPTVSPKRVGSNPTGRTVEILLPPDAATDKPRSLAVGVR